MAKAQQDPAPSTAARHSTARFPSSTPSSASCSQRQTYRMSLQTACPPRRPRQLPAWRPRAPCGPGQDPSEQCTLHLGALQMPLQSSGWPQPGPSCAPHPNPHHHPPPSFCRQKLVSETCCFRLAQCKSKSIKYQQSITTHWAAATSGCCSAGCWCSTAVSMAASGSCASSRCAFTARVSDTDAPAGRTWHKQSSTRCSCGGFFCGSG